jgi:hypothetical protein
MLQDLENVSEFPRSQRYLVGGQIAFCPKTWTECEFAVQLTDVGLNIS